MPIFLLNSVHPGSHSLTQLPNSTLTLPSCNLTDVVLKVQCLVSNYYKTSCKGSGTSSCTSIPSLWIRCELWLLSTLLLHPVVRQCCCQAALAALTSRALWLSSSSWFHNASDRSVCIRCSASATRLWFKFWKYLRRVIGTFINVNVLWSPLSASYSLAWGVDMPIISSKPSFQGLVSIELLSDSFFWICTIRK